ncbi:DUF4368 domain-containing protein [Pseudogracilibacillus sp. SO30301A]|uniref:DUF4368 domain-containing protein n=1 Tax=Pseudogracilibacillus sp. SO30301A TaxID=3098291 RepID=UPI00300E0FCE
MRITFSGKLNDHRFLQLSSEYEKEQEALKVTLTSLQKELDKQEKKKVDVQQFVKIARTYTTLEKLDTSIVRECIEKIFVSAKDKKTKTQEITIVYNFIGAFDFKQANHRAKREDKIRKVGII